MTGKWLQAVLWSGALAAVALGGQSLVGQQAPAAGANSHVETAVMTGDIAFRQHSSGHTPGPNWPVFIEFAARYFDAPGVKSASR